MAHDLVEEPRLRRSPQRAEDGGGGGGGEEEDGGEEHGVLLTL